jgi:hypothetical protein
MDNCCKRKKYLVFRRLATCFICNFTFVMLNRCLGSFFENCFVHVLLIVCIKVHTFSLFLLEKLCLLTSCACKHVIFVFHHSVAVQESSIFFVGCCFNQQGS